MKKRFLFLLILMMMPKIFSQDKELTDEQIKKILVEENAFGKYLVCNDDNTFVSSFKTRDGDGYHVEGTFQIRDGIIVFSVNKNISGYNSISTDENGYLNFTYQYSYLPDRYDYQYNHYGCLCSLDDDTCFWSEKPIPENMLIKIDGIKAYKLYTNIYINENLKMRETDYSKAKLVTVNGCDFDLYGDEYVEDPRTIVFKGMVISPIAKSLVKETVDGITAPWYYIAQQDHDSSGRNEGEIHFVWIFGGYVTEFSGDEFVQDSKVLKQSVESVGLKFYRLHNSDIEQK